MNPKGTIVFASVGRAHYGFDIFSVQLPATENLTTTERCLTDGVSVNFNGQFVDDDDYKLVYVSERTGSARVYLNTSDQVTETLPGPPESLFCDRPVVKNGKLYFISAHEQPAEPFKSWSALFETSFEDKKVVRLTPNGSVDFSPALSQSGRFVAVASYGDRSWGGEFHDLQADIVVFRESEPTKRTVVCHHGGWPTWSGDSSIYFHRQADDGWWSIFRVDLSDDFETSGLSNAPKRITPSGLHCFTPAAMHDSNRIAVATRRRDSNYRHVEIFDAELQKFYPVTQLLNPNFHHYNPFLSQNSLLLGYHRFRGVSAPGESIIPHLDPVLSPIRDLRLLRINGAFPSFSPSGEFIAFNHDFDSNSGLKLLKSDGSKRWNLLKDRTTFYNSWSPAEKNVIFTSIGPIFESVKATVQIARISFDASDITDDREDIPVDVKILTREETGNNAFPSCSPDGKRLVFRSGRTGNKNLFIIDAFEGEYNGGALQLTNGPWIDTMPSWSPDGKLIAFSSNMHSPENVDVFSLYLIHPDGTGLRRIHVAASEESSDVNRERLNHVCFSADGEWLLFTANIGAVTAEPVSLPNQFQPYGDLYMVRLDGSGLKRLTWNGYENGTPAWHPGGELELKRLKLGEFGDKLDGQFDEPLWIRCDF